MTTTAKASYEAHRANLATELADAEASYIATIKSRPQDRHAERDAKLALDIATSRYTRWLSARD